MAGRTAAVPYGIGEQHDSHRRGWANGATRTTLRAILIPPSSATPSGGSVRGLVDADLKGSRQHLRRSGGQDRGARGKTTRDRAVNPRKVFYDQRHGRRPRGSAVVRIIEGPLTRRHTRYGGVTTNSGTRIIRRSTTTGAWKAERSWSWREVLRGGHAGERAVARVYVAGGPSRCPACRPDRRPRALHDEPHAPGPTSWVARPRATPLVDHRRGHRGRELEWSATGISRHMLATGLAALRAGLQGVAGSALQLLREPSPGGGGLASRVVRADALICLGGQLDVALAEPRLCERSEHTAENEYFMELASTGDQKRWSCAAGQVVVQLGMWPAVGGPEHVRCRPAPVRVDEKWPNGPWSAWYPGRPPRESRSQRRPGMVLC